MRTGVRGYSPGMDPRRLAVVVVLAVAACAPATENRPSQTTATTTTATTTAAAASLSPACGDVVDKAQALLTAVGRYASGKAAAEQVRSAADELSDSFDQAKTELGPDAQAALDKAGRALRDVLDVLSTQPVDTNRLRTAAGQVVTALGEAATVCTSSSTEPTSSPEPTTESVTTTS
jgi:outer membrane protein OmpA-like peptidoglycan-associated protein